MGCKSFSSRAVTRAVSLPFAQKSTRHSSTASRSTFVNIASKLGKIAMTFSDGRSSATELGLEQPIRVVKRLRSRDGINQRQHAEKRHRAIAQSNRIYAYSAGSALRSGKNNRTRSAQRRSNALAAVMTQAIPNRLRPDIRTIPTRIMFASTHG